MLIGACGLLWDRDAYDWKKTAGRRLIGRRGLNKGFLQVADFSSANGIYILYNQVGVYYVGLTAKNSGLSGRLTDHTTDRHANQWSRFSWFAFDSPSESTEKDDDGVLLLDRWSGYEDLETEAVIAEMEAVLIAALVPPGNRRKMRFGDAQIWTQVAMSTPDMRTFESLKDRLQP